MSFKDEVELDYIFGSNEDKELLNSLNNIPSSVSYQNIQIDLEDDQLTAVKGILAWLHQKVRKPYIRLSGYAGTGKSVLIAYLLQNRQEIFPSEFKFRPICVCTYTWKASLVLQARGVNSVSIHSIFYKPIVDEESGQLRFVRRPDYEILETYSIIIIDEASMVSEDIRNDLEAIGIPILYVGDAAQLPEISKSFKKGSSSKDFMEDAEFTLTKVRRQALESPIIRLSMDIREGKSVPFGKYGKGVFKIESEELSDKLILASDQLICGKNITRTFLNEKVRELKGYDRRLGPYKGERIIGLNNFPQKGLFNGQDWIVVNDHSDIPLASTNYFYTDIQDPNIALYKDDISKNSGIYKCNIAFPDNIANMISLKDPGLSTFLKENGLYSVDFGYAITVHKSQGSSFKRPIIFEERLGNSTFHRKWLYTAVTRAVDKLIIVN